MRPILLLAMMTCLGSLLLFIPHAQAQGPVDRGIRAPLGPHELVDPIDGGHFQIQVVLSTNGLGGYDADGCRYARGLQTRTYSLATSPSTGFTADLAGFARNIPEAEKPALLLWLAGQGKPSQIASRPVWERYRLAAQLAEHIGDSPLAVAELYLQGAWTVRDRIVGFLPRVEGAADAWSKLGEILPKARSLKDPRPRTVALFDLARLAHRGGFPIERNDFLSLLDTFEDAGLGGKEKRTEFLRLVEVENSLLAAAQASFQSWLDSGYGSLEEQTLTRYQVAELARRRGRFDESEALLEGLSLIKTASEETQAMIRDVQAVLKVQSRGGEGEAGGQELLSGQKESQ